MLTNIVWLLNPDRIVIGGGVAKAGPLLFEPIKRTIRERTSAVFHENLEVVPAELGNDGGMIGSAALAIDGSGTFSDLTSVPAVFCDIPVKKSVFAGKTAKLTCQQARKSLPYAPA